MHKPASPWLDLLVLPVVLASAAGLWWMHANAWDLGGRSPILNYDTAQYALAGRELAWHGDLASPFALPIDLVHHASPPWPLAVLQPGLVLFEGAVFRLVPARGQTAGPDPRAWLTLLLPFCCFLMLAASLALSVRHLFARWWPDAPWRARAGAALTLGLYFALDPEAQHFAIGGFTELPFTLGLMFALLGLALEAPVRRPLLFGAVLGLAGLFRANMLGLVPLFAIGAAVCAPAPRRLRTALLVLVGFALPLAPWWFYKWRAFGSPAWDLTRYVVWDGVQGRTWFSLYHQAALPELPHGAAGPALLAAKVLHNLPGLVGQMLAGPRGLWFGGLVGWLVLARPPRPLAAAGGVALGAAALGVLGAAVSIPWLRYLFPTRVLFEPVGLLALWALLERIPATSLHVAWRRTLLVATAALALAWGGWCTARGLEEARLTSRERGVPSTSALTSLSIMLSGDLAPGEPLMSNLGPALAWQTNHPVVHLALTPDDVESCRRRLDFRHIVLVFRGDRRAWPGWNEIVEREGLARTLPRLGVTAERRYRTADGFEVVWLVLGPLGPTLAANAGR
jgi:hypothetical protein